jgi:uncharacterized protein YdhG (YjbR/CyaY superfamily)
MEDGIMSFDVINEYANGLEENGKKSVLEFASFMEAEYPQLLPKICFAMPMWWLGAKMYDGYVGISAAKKHYSIHFHEESYIDALKKALPNCSFGRKCVNIKYGDEQALSVVKHSVMDYINKALGK